jgi:O-acetyl-ADP-ribose deacetylase (regulator of RNase III)
MKLEIVRGDITQLDVDAVVNAANGSLMGGQGVDGAIHSAAGPELQQACAELGGCVTGDAKATEGFRLKAKWIFHAVGPVWHGGTRGEDDCLARCYTRCMELASSRGVGVIAFPAISTGAYGFPRERAAEIAIRQVKQAGNQTSVKRVLFCCFDDETEAIYRRLLGSTAGETEAQRPATSVPGGFGAAG